MATKVTMTLPPILVQSTDIELEVRLQDLELLGRLKMSRGGLDWFKKGAKSRPGGPPGPSFGTGWRVSQCIQGGGSTTGSQQGRNIPPGSSRGEAASLQWVNGRDGEHSQPP